MKLPSIILLLLSTILSISPAQSQQKTITKIDYSIKGPADWSIDSSRQYGADVIFFTMLENTNDKFRENVNVITQPLSDNAIDLAKYTAISTGQIQNMAPDAKIELSTTLKAGNYSYQKMIYTATQSNLKLKFEQFYFVANKKAYVITFTAEQTKFDAYKTVGEQILNSFVLK